MPAACGPDRQPPKSPLPDPGGGPKNITRITWRNTRADTRATGCATSFRPGTNWARGARQDGVDKPNRPPFENSGRTPFKAGKGKGDGLLDQKNSLCSFWPLVTPYSHENVAGYIISKSPSFDLSGCIRDISSICVLSLPLKPSFF
jgi:hypothetical protein